MKEKSLERLRYPIGKFDWDSELNPKTLEEAIIKIEIFPLNLTQTVSSLADKTLRHRYRPNGWTIAQVIHHLADSHMHSYLRFKHAILEDTPSIKDYEEAKWANLPDASTIEIDYSLNLIKALHFRWVFFLKELKFKDYKKCYFHRERNKYYPLDTTLLIYAWHCDHHLAHIKNAIKKGY